MKKTFDIGKVHIENPWMVAPLAGVSNIAFRRISKRIWSGTCMTMKWSVIKTLYYASKKTFEMCRCDSHETSCQLSAFGHDMDTVVYAAKFLDTQTDCDIN